MIAKIAVLPSLRSRSIGRLSVGTTVCKCALGRAGIVSEKREGDGATPAGKYRLRFVAIRRDRVSPFRSALPCRRTRPSDAWCDDPRSSRYNLPVRMPIAASHERMWREDRLYDIVVILDHNTRPRKKGRGSAIFLHLTNGEYSPTAGCLAVSLADIRRVLSRLGRRTIMEIMLPGGRLTRAKYRGPDAYVGRSKLNRKFIVRAHPHREFLNTISTGYLS